MWDADTLDKLRYSGLLSDLKGVAHWCNTASNDGHLNSALARLTVVVDAINELLINPPDTIEEDHA